jgi:hypothetical protein
VRALTQQIEKHSPVYRLLAVRRCAQAKLLKTVQRGGSVTAQTVIAVAMLVAASSTAFADPITMTASRSVFVMVSFEDSEGFNANDHQQASSETLGRFQVSREVFAQTDLASMSALVSQDTNVDPLRGRIVGSGSGVLPGSANADFLEVNLATSELDVTFTLTRATPFRFRGTLMSTTDKFGEGFAQAGLDNLFRESNASSPFDHRGILQPGGHGLFALASVGDAFGATGFGQSSFEFDFSLGSAATPEPATLALLATGLGAAVASRRRRSVAR